MRICSKPREKGQFLVLKEVLGAQRRRYLARKDGGLAHGPESRRRPPRPTRRPPPLKSWRSSSLSSNRHASFLKDANNLWGALRRPPTGKKRGPVGGLRRVGWRPSSSGQSPGPAAPEGVLLRHHPQTTFGPFQGPLRDAIGLGR